QGRDAGPFNCGNVDERVRLAIIALDEAKTLHRVKELDRAAGLLAGQLALWPGRGAAPLDGHRFAFDAEVGCRDAAAAVDERELERLAVGEVGETRLLDRRDVHEYVLAPIVPDNEAEALL